MAEVRYSWTQPICGGCYDERYPGRQPSRIKLEFADRETCVDCGNPTGEGIYYRIDPAKARFPTRVKDDE